MAENISPLNYQEKIETIHSSDGTTLCYREWDSLLLPEQSPPPKGLILLVHGYGEHLGRYRHLIGALTSAGYRVGGIDHKGMGNSGGEPGIVHDFSEYIADLDVALKRLKSADVESMPCFIYGHSMGGLVALLHASRNPESPVSGTILSAPLLGVAMQVPHWQLLTGRALRHLMPKFHMPFHLDPNILTRDPEDQKEIIADKLILKHVGLCWFFASRRAMNEAAAEARDIIWPTLWLIPVDDRLCDSKASFAAFNKLDRKIKHACKQYPILAHEMHNESRPDREKLFTDILAWLDSQIIDSE